MLGMKRTGAMSSLRRRREVGTDCEYELAIVGPQASALLIVQDGELYAVTWTYDWTRVKQGNHDPGRVYRFAGDAGGEDCGQPSDNRTLNCIASFRGKLYVGGGPEHGGVFTQDDGAGTAMRVDDFSQGRPERRFPCDESLQLRLDVAYPAAFPPARSGTMLGPLLRSNRCRHIPSRSTKASCGRGTWRRVRLRCTKGARSWRVGAESAKTEPSQFTRGLNGTGAPFR